MLATFSQESSFINSLKSRIALMFPKEILKSKVAVLLFKIFKNLFLLLFIKALKKIKSIQSVKYS